MTINLVSPSGSAAVVASGLAGVILASVWFIRWFLKEAYKLQCWIHTQKDVTDTTQLCFLVCIRDFFWFLVWEKLDIRNVGSVTPYSSQYVHVFSYVQMFWLPSHLISYNSNIFRWLRAGKLWFCSLTPYLLLMFALHTPPLSAPLYSPRSWTLLTSIVPCSPSRVVW